MGRRGARPPAADVPHRRGPPSGERRPAIYVSVALGGPADCGPARYTLDTILSTLGLPYTLSADPAEWHEDVGRCVFLSLGPVDLPPNSSLMTHDPSLALAFSALAREEELAVETRDDFDRFQWEHTTSHPSPAAVLPSVSEQAQLLLDSAREAFTRAGLPLIRKECWPGGKPMAACLTHDVDVVRRGKLPRGVALRDVSAALSSLARARLPSAAERIARIARTASAGQDPYWTFDRIAALEQKHGYRATYFFMAGRHHPQDAAYDLAQPAMAGLLQALAKSGCEIGLHGSYGSYTDAASLREQKSRLEKLLGEEVPGHRNHFLRFRVPDSWAAHEAAGFSYDATLGFADHEGFRSGHAFPFHPYDLSSGRTLELLEIPLTLMDVTLSKYRRLRGHAAEEAAETVLAQARSVGGLATLLWHNDTFYDPDYPGSAALYEAALAWLDSNGAHVAPCRDVDRWWRAREAATLFPLAGERWGWGLIAPLEIEGLVLRVSLPNPQGSLRLKGDVTMSLHRDGPDYLLEFARLPANSRAVIECC